MFLAALDQNIVAATLPRVAADLQGASSISWVVSIYLLTSTPATLIYGKLSDLYGRRIMFQIAIVVFTLTSVLCALAASMGQLIASRALQGLGGGGLVVVAHATIADIVSPRERGRYQGYFASVFPAANVLGPALVSLFASYLTWRWVFWINLPLGLAAFTAPRCATFAVSAHVTRTTLTCLLRIRGYEAYRIGRFSAAGTEPSSHGTASRGGCLTGTIVHATNFDFSCSEQLAAISVILAGLLLLTGYGSKFRAPLWISPRLRIR